MSAAERWVSLHAAAALIEGEGLDHVHAKARIADKLRDGLLPAKAAIYAQRPATGPVDWNRPTVDAGKRIIVGLNLAKLNHEVDASIWLESRDWQSDIAQWQWGRGNIVIHRVGARTSQARVQMWGVTIDASKMQPAATVREEQPARAQASPRGAKLNSDWAEWVASLSALINDKELPIGCSGRGLHKLVTANMRPGAKELDYAKVQPIARAVLKRLGEES